VHLPFDIAIIVDFLGLTNSIVLYQYSWLSLIFFNSCLYSAGYSFEIIRLRASRKIRV
jgi:hypothetical protein